MRSIDPQSLSPQATMDFLTRAVAPRPIALVSTISAAGVANLAPFSFFNAFGGNPPVVAFSPSRRARDGTLKDTYRNLMATKECVVHVVTRDIVEKTNVASGEYPPDTDEFPIAGFTALPALKVKPPRAAESPIHLECRMIQMVHLGDKPASGNLAICEIVQIHVAEPCLGTDGKIDIAGIGHVARNGSEFYTHVTPASLFELKKPSI